MSITTHEQTISAQHNPEAAAALAAQAMREADAPDQKAPEPRAVTPPEAEVVLPGGFLDLLTQEVHKTAEVRELTGADEEALAKAGGSFAKVFDTILQRGVVKIGDQPAREVLDMLLSGDRDALVLAIRCATYGDLLEMSNVSCPHCYADQHDVAIDLTTEVPTRLLEGEREFVVETRRGEAVVSLPTGSTQRALLLADKATGAELNTLLLSHTVQSIGGQPVLDPRQVREGLGAADRRKILDAITKNVPGPRLGEVSKPCQSCGDSIPLPLTLADLFLV